MTTDAGTPGLRERKKARTRGAIQEVALRLFREQGYAETTVEKIAAAAEVSERTFFRYFPTKADTVAYDLIEPMVVDAFAAQPAELGPATAMRAAVREVYGRLPPERLELERQRQRLIAEVSGLHALSPQKVQLALSLLTNAVSHRTGRPSDDPIVSAWTGAIGGVAIVSYVTWVAHPVGSVIERIDTGLRLLEDGLPL
jgi:AcrR family transcriptional regulator